MEPSALQVAVNKGFTPGASFKATLSGSGDLFLLGLNATDLTLTNNGCAMQCCAAGHDWHCRLHIAAGVDTPADGAANMSGVCRAS